MCIWWIVWERRRFHGVWHNDGMVFPPWCVGQCHWCKRHCYADPPLHPIVPDLLPLIPQHLVAMMRRQMGRKEVERRIGASPYPNSSAMAAQMSSDQETVMVVVLVEQVGSHKCGCLEQQRIQQSGCTTWAWKKWQRRRKQCPDAEG